MLGKAQRQHRIAQILEAQPVSNQAHLVELLAESGVLVNQATVSRDLDDMGAIKIRTNAGEPTYAIPVMPKDQLTTADHLRRVLAEWAVEVTVAQNLVVVRTPPGCAHVVASAIDRGAIDGVVGCVAGDDTIMIVATDLDSATSVGTQLSELAGL